MVVLRVSGATLVLRWKRRFVVQEVKSSTWVFKHPFEAQYEFQFKIHVPCRWQPEVALANCLAGTSTAKPGSASLSHTADCVEIRITLCRSKIANPSVQVRVINAKFCAHLLNYSIREPMFRW